MENVIEIWSPKFSTMEVLIKPFNVKDGMNKIIFTKTWRDKVLLMEGDKLRTYPMISHGKTSVYVVPVKDFDQEATRQMELIK